MNLSMQYVSIATVNKGVYIFYIVIVNERFDYLNYN